MDDDVRHCKKISISSSRSTNQVIRSFECTRMYLLNRYFHRADCCSGNAWMFSDLISWLSRPTYAQLTYFSSLQNLHTHSGPTDHPIEGYQGRESDFSPRLVSSVLLYFSCPIVVRNLAHLTTFPWPDYTRLVHCATKFLLFYSLLTILPAGTSSHV